MRSTAELRFAYTSAFLAYLDESDERARRTAYELGREAVAAGLGVMDLADTHHHAVLAALRGGTAPDATARAAGDFFLETLSAFEMVQRGLGEMRDLAERERRHSAMLRRLSSFLDDASLAVSAGESIHEILRLVAEQARELIGGVCCVVTVSSGRDGPQARAASFSEGETVLGARLALGDLSPLEQLVVPLGPVARMDPKHVLPQPASEPDDGGMGARSWLAAPLTRLDGRQIGFIHLFDRRPGAYGSEAEAILLHLAQMGSAAVDRVCLYGGGASDAARPTSQDAP